MDMSVGVGGVPCTHDCICADSYACTCAYDIIGFPRDFLMGSELHEIIMFIMHACACVLDTPYTPTPTHIHHPTHPQGGPQTSKNLISVEPIEIIEHP